MSVISQNHAQRTGAWTYTRELIRQLGERPEAVRLEVLANEIGVKRLAAWAPDTVRVNQVIGYRPPDGTVARVVAMSATRLRPRLFARQFSPDLDLVHYPLTLTVPRVRGRRVMTLHDIQHHDLPDAFSAARHRWRAITYDQAAQRATFVITDSDHARERIVEVLGVAPERIATVHLGVDATRFTPEPAASDDRALAGLQLPLRFVYYPASLWDHKNHLRLLDAMRLVADDRLGLVLSGATFGRLPWLRAAAAERGLEHRIRHLGFVSDEALPALYRRALALVFPSLYEGFGVPPLEAMACGCPVASSLAGSLAEVCSGVVAELDPADPRQIAGTIDAVTDDLSERARLRQAGRERIGMYTWRRSTDQLLDAYRRAAQLEP